MDALTIARLQFAITTVYHFFFVPLTMGLAILVAIMETSYVSTGKGANSAHIDNFLSMFDPVGET